MMTPGELKTFSVRVMRRMQEARITEAELARRLKVELSLVRRWKFGNACPQGALMKRLANVLQVEEGYLTGEQDKARVKLMEVARRAEKMIIDGGEPNAVAETCGYKNVQSMYSSIAAYTETAVYTDEEKANFCANIKQLLVERDMTNAQFAWAVGVSQGSVSKWVGGSNLPIRCLIKRIAHVLGTTGRELLGGPVLAEDTIKRPPPEKKDVKKAEAEGVKKDNRMELPEKCEEVGGLRIKVKHTAEANGRYAEYYFDGVFFTVKMEKELKGITPEVLMEVGEEMQQAAISMTK